MTKYVSPFLLLKLSYFFSKLKQVDFIGHASWSNVFMRKNSLDSMCIAMRQWRRRIFLFYSSPYYFPCHSKYSHIFCLSDEVKKWKNIENRSLWWRMWYFSHETTGETHSKREFNITFSSLVRFFGISHSYWVSWFSSFP